MLRPPTILRRHLLPLVAACTLTLQACATTAAVTAPVHRLGPPTEADRAAVERLRREVPEQIADQAERLWRLWTRGEDEGVGDETEGPSEADVLALRRVRAAAKDAEERRALGLLEAHLVGELLARETAGLREREDAILATPSLEIDGRRAAFRELGPLLAREADHERRVRISASSAPVLRELDRVAADGKGRVAALADRLGYDGAAELEAISLPLPRGRLRKLASAFLAATDDPYRRALAEAARRELGLSPGELRRADLPRLFGGVLFEVRFPSGGRQALERTLAALGIEPAAPVRIDDSGGPHRVERAACFPVRPPEDVRLALPSVPGGDWRPTFREAACAWSMAHAADDRFEFARLGSPGIASGLAEPLAGLPDDPAWLRGHTLLTEAEIEAQTAGAAFQRLFVARRAAGKILADGDRGAMERALAVPIVPEEGGAWLVSRDGGDSPRDFVGWLLGAMARARLEALHGESWWSSQNSGRILASLWAGAGRLDPDGAARVLGAMELSAAPLAELLGARVAPLLRPPSSKTPTPPTPPAKPVAPADETPAPEADEPAPALSRAEDAPARRADPVGPSSHATDCA